MANSARLGPGRIARFAVLALGLLIVGWLAVRAASVRALPAQSSAIAAIAPGNAQVVLDRVSEQVLSAKVPPPASVYVPVGAAANGAPLDERPFLLFAVRALADGRDADGLKLLEEARRRNPRQRYVRLLLLDRYMRAGRSADAVTEMAVLTRLLPAAGSVLADAMAGLAIDPTTRGPARRALDTDPALLNQVLAAMADKTGPATVLRFAGPNAPAGLQANGWRTVLVTAMIKRGQIAQARELWLRMYGVDPARTKSAIYDGAFQGSRAAAPFNWTLAADEVGAAEIGGGALSVEYYGRRSGPLASQLLVLRPGRYRLTYLVSGSGGDESGSLTWSISCQGVATNVLATSPASPLRPVARRVTAEFTVPANGCPSQSLSLDGQSGGFAGSTSARLTGLALEPLS